MPNQVERRQIIEPSMVSKGEKSSTSILIQLTWLENSTQPEALIKMTTGSRETWHYFDTVTRHICVPFMPSISYSSLLTERNFIHSFLPFATASNTRKFKWFPGSLEIYPRSWIHERKTVPPSSDYTWSQQTVAWALFPTYAIKAFRIVCMSTRSWRWRCR